MGIEAQMEEREIMSGDEEGKTITAENIATTNEVILLGDRLLRLEDKQAQDNADLEDLMATYRAEGDIAHKRHNAIVDILLEVIGGTIGRTGGTE